MNYQYDKEILVKNYFEIYDFYLKIYGLKSIIIIQVGSFHEIYSDDTKNTGPDLKKLSVELDIICTKKGQLNMMGFPSYCCDKFIEKLVDLNYTIIKIDQTTEAPKPKREIVGIFSSATYVEKLDNKIRNIISIVIEKLNNNLCFGLSVIDLSTNFTSYSEYYSNDLILTLNDVNIFLESYKASEIIFYTSLDEDDKINNMNIKNIKNYLNLDEKIIFNHKLKNTNKLSYQKIIFEKIFPDEKNVFEKTNLHLYNFARWSLINLYEYVKNHSESLLEKLKLPIEFDKKILYLGNNSLNQLNVINKNLNEKSLFNIINNTKTQLGKRFLNDVLTKPLIDENILNERYNLIDKIIKNNYSITLSNLLEDIYDIDKIIRRMELSNINPCEFYLLYLSFYQTEKIIKFCEENKIFNINNKLDVNVLLNYIKSTFDLQKISSLNFNNLTDTEDNIFQLNKYTEIDQLCTNIKSSTNFLDELVVKLSDLIDDKKIFKKDNEDDKNMITLKFNERDGHYLYVTNRRCEMLKKNIQKIVIGKHELNINDFEFNLMPKSSYTKINCKKIKYISDELIVDKIKLAKLIKEKFKIEMTYILEKFNDTINYWSKEIAFIDFINSGAITSIKNHYSKPCINKTNNSYVIANKLRHPIVEYISTNYEYKTHDIELGIENQCGILLYGINSSGKSTLMKSIGLNIILAQIGYYVASENFIYSPYYSLFTRIISNDNIYNGLSSFALEMIEISAILKRNNSNTLVIADELCKTTESSSAIVIVAHLIKKLSESNTSFITASHLHEISELKTIKKLTNVKAKHIKLSYDKINDKLIYDRILTDGSGPNFYGLQFAKYYIKDLEFNRSTTEILDEYNNHTIKQSKYNTDNYLIECEICKNKNNLETHHIVFQKEFNDFVNEKLHYKKDDNYNLVTLCQTCHDDVDRNKIIIYGWIESNINKRELNYKINEEIKKTTKHSNELIEYIKNLKLENIDHKFAKIKIKEKFNKKISTKTIETYWSNININE
jgi:DNA mismatch repair protein MutS